MTNLNADSANDIPMPVSDWQNEDVKGLALCVDSIFNDKIEKVAKLRKQQQQYKNSLQMTPEKFLSKARGTLNDQTERDGPVSVSVHCFHIIRELLVHADNDNFPDLKHAMAYIAEHGVDAALSTKSDLEKLNDALGVLSDATDIFKSLTVKGATS